MDETAMTHLDTRRAPTSEKSAGKSASIELKISELYEQYVSLIYNYLLSRVQNSAIAEDLTSQTFLSAVENRSSVKDPEKVRPWLFTIAGTRRTIISAGPSVIPNRLLKKKWTIGLPPVQPRPRNRMS